MSEVKPTEILIDTRELEPPEPLILLFEALKKVESGSFVRMLHRFEPCSIYERLEPLQMDVISKKIDENAWEIFMYKRGDEAVKEFLQDSLC